MTGGEREVVKLSLGNDRPALNVLPVGLEGETMTLVCPFPVLPIEVPVSVTLPGREEEEPVRATIRRVGVELMGDSAIPRFKLQLTLDAGEDAKAIEIPIMFDDPDEPTVDMWASPSEEAAQAGEPAEEESSTAEAEALSADVSEDIDVEQAEPEGAEEPSESEEVDLEETPEVEARADEEEPDIDESASSDSEESASCESEEASVIVDDGLSWYDDEEPEAVAPPAEMSWSAGELFGSEDDPDEERLDWDEGDTLETPVDDDPPWADIEDGEAVGADLGEPPRASRWPVRMGVSLALIVSVLAVGYVMREQVAELAAPYVGEELTLAALGLSAEDSASPATEALTPSASVSETETEATEAAAAAVAEETEGAEEADQASPVDEEAPSPALDEPVEEPEAAAAEEVEEEAHLQDDVEHEAAVVNDEPEMEGSIQLAANAGESSAPDPSVEERPDNLRVVLPTRWPVTEASSYRLHDPTGIVVDIPGGVAAERARWIDTEHERVRSVRVLERENGVRFIIYLNDEFVPRYRVGYNRAGVTVDILGPDARHQQHTK